MSKEKEENWFKSFVVCSFREWQQYGPFQRRVPSQLKKPFVSVGRRGSHEQGNGQDLILVFLRTWRLTLKLDSDATCCKDTGRPETTDREATLQMCRDLYECPGFVGIRDKFVQFSIFTDDSRIDFNFMFGAYVLRTFASGKLVEKRTGLDYKTFFQLVNMLCIVQGKHQSNWIT